MKVEINRERLAATFTELCQISSPSRREGNIARHLKKVFADLGADSVYEDDSAPRTGSESGNLIIRFNGTGTKTEGFFFSCHKGSIFKFIGRSKRLYLLYNKDSLGSTNYFRYLGSAY